MHQYLETVFLGIQPFHVLLFICLLVSYLYTKLKCLRILRINWFFFHTEEITLKNLFYYKYYFSYLFLVLYLFPENIMFVFIIIIVFLDSSKTHLLPYPPNFVSSMCLTLFYLACVAFHWSLGNLPVDTDLKETYSPSLRNYLLLMERFETYGSPPISIVVSGLAWAFPGLLYLFTGTVFINAALLFTEKKLLPCYYTSSLAFKLFLHLFQNNIWVWGGIVWGRCSISWWVFTVSYSLKRVKMKLTCNGVKLLSLDTKG